MNKSLRFDRVAIVLLAIILANAYCLMAQNSVNVGQPNTPATVLDSTRQQDGLLGSVRRVKTQTAKLEFKAGQLVEGPLQPLEVTTYSLSGQRIENVSYPIASSPVGKEEYKYDNKGNIVEMTLRGSDGSILSREAYEYEFDRFGNWTKMVTNLVVFEGGDLKREPIEVTYRTLTYYFDDAVAGIVDSKPRATAARLPDVTTAKVADDSTFERPALSLSDSSTRPSNASLLNDAPPVAPPIASTKKSDVVVTPVETKPTSEPLAPPKVIRTANSAAGETVANNAANTAPGTSISKSKLALQFYQDGRQRFDSGDFAAAIVAYQHSLQIDPESAEVNVSLGHAFYRLKKNEESMKAFKQAIGLNPEMPEAYYGLGLDYFGLKRYRDAAAAFKRATVLRPSLAKAHYGLALAYQEMGKESELIEEYRILQTLDHALAQQLATTFPEFNLPCRAAPFCK